MEGAPASATSRVPALIAAATVLLLLALVGWWLAVDGQPPDFDSGKHLLHAWAYTDSFEAGDLTAPLTEFTQYPPLAHVVGALGALAGGVEVASTVLAAAFVFLPLLGLGMYRAGRIVGGPWTGALAMVFIAGAPLLLTSARAFLLETYVTALLACAVWLLLESRRFERPWHALAAGVAVSLGLLVKQPFAFFVAGVPLVMLARGGWRRPLGLAAFAAPVLVLGAPWYIGHWDELRSTAEWVTGVNSEGPLLGAKNLSYYGWSVLNRGLMLPLALIGALGVIGAALRFARRPEPSSWTPELLAGLVIGWAGITFYVHLKAPYYALPLLVYVGLLSAGWITALGSASWRRAAAWAVVAIAALNLVIAGFHLGEPVRVALPGASDAPGPAVSRHVTLVSPEAWPASLPPGDGNDVLPLLRALRASGVEVVEFDPAPNLAWFNATGLSALARVAGLARPPVYDPASLEAPREAFVGVQFSDDPRPACVDLGDDLRVYITEGSPLSGPRTCPLP